MRLALGLAAAAIGIAVSASAATCPQLDPDTLRCQQAVGRAGAAYVTLRTNAVQQCLNKIQRGELTGDPVTVCRGTLGVPPTDPRTAEKIAHAESRVADTLAARCSDPIVASLELCAATVGGLATCLVADHWTRTEAAIEAEYGTVGVESPPEQDCQEAVARWAGRYLSTRVKAIARCFDTRNKRTCGSNDPLPNCLDPSATGPSAERLAAAKIARARDKMVQRIGQVCSDPELGALDACAATLTGLDDCLLCSHDNAAALLVAGEYEAVAAASPTGPSLQSIADAADDGDTILLEPGTYFGQTMELKDSGLSVIGIKTCDTGARAVIVDDPMAPQANGIVSCGSLSSGCTDVADDLLLQGFEVNDFEENDVLTIGADGVTYRDMITRGPHTSTGTEYGLFPILSNDVLIEDSVVADVRDAGIYVGQSTNIIIRNNEVYGNVAGIEVENSANAEVYGNYAHDNSGGILVFKLVLPTQYSNCHNIHDNIVTNNNGANYGSGLVGAVPVGTGILILSNDTSVFQDNIVTGNDTFGIVLTDQNVLNILYDPDFFPTPSPDQAAEFNSFVGNTQTGNGTNPDPIVPEVFSSNGAVVITGSSPGNGNCGDDVARYCKLPPNSPCTSDAQCPDSDPMVDDNRCFGNYFWNAMPPCSVPPPQPNCPLVTTTSTTSTSSTTSTTLLYTWTQIQGMFTTRCASCHTSGSSGNLTGLNDYNTGYNNIENVPSSELPSMDRVEPNNSAQSYLMHKLDGTHVTAGGSGVRMPLGGPYFTQTELDGVRAWINTGAPQN
jgi:parallel beta-helix repeat protein